MSLFFYSLGSVFLVSLISLIGIFTLYTNEEKLRKIITFLVSLAAGGLLGDAFIHLIPQSFERLDGKLTVPALVLVGILLFFILEKFIRWRHCHIKTSENHLHPVAFMNIVGDSIHNFTDGVAIGASFLVSLPVGVATTLAVILHEIPQEMGDFGILIKWGLSAKKALFFNFLTALTSLAGVGLVFMIGDLSKYLSLILLPVIAGGFLYIAGSDLIPELHNNKCETHLFESLVQLTGIVLGLVLMVLLSLME
ncbi:MAG: ZIP family metal transporter [Patescibacteria group bacterium]|nr:ZIP family metal transporter [Patescibacteria group bacterium]